MKKLLGICLVLLMLYEPHWANATGEQTLELPEITPEVTIPLPEIDIITGSELPTDSFIEEPSVESVFSGTTDDIPFTGDIQNTGNMTGEVIPEFAGSQDIPLIEPLLLPQLIISEVFFDGSDEWFEIANIGSGGFSGNLTVKGVKSSDLILSNISIPSQSIFIRGDTMSQITIREIIKGSNLGLSISDSNALHVSIWSSGLLLDELQADSAKVSSLPNHFGFEKVRSGSSLITIQTSTGRTANVLSPLAANPGVIFSLPPTLIAPGLPPATGSDILTGQDLSPPHNTSIAFISEIHATNDILPEYIEVHFTDHYFGQLTIGGLGSSAASKTFSVHAFPGQYLVITDTFSGFADTGSVLLLDSISLTDGGELLTMSNTSGTIYDSISYSGTAKNTALYRDSQGHFTISTYLTPGYSEKSLVYIFPNGSLSGSSEKQPESYYQALYKKWKDRYYDIKSQLSAFGMAIDKAGRAYRKDGAVRLELIDGSEEFTEDIIAANSILRILAVLPDPDGKDENQEQITIELLSGDAIDLQDITLRINSKKTRLDGLLQSAGHHLTIKGTLGFVNKPACAILQSDEIIYDTFCYGQPKAGQRITLTGNITDAPSLSGIVDFSRMKELSLKILTGQVCALFDDKTFSCMTVKPILDEKKKAQYEKKIASAEKKLEKKTTQYTTLQERYKKSKTTLEAKRRKYYEQVKTVRNTYKGKLAVSNLEKKVWKNYSKLVEKELKKNRSVVRKHGNMSTISSLLQINLQALSGDKVDYYGQSFTVGDFQKQFIFATDPAVLIDYMLGDGLTYIDTKLGNKWKNALHIWYSDTQ